MPEEKTEGDNVQAPRPKRMIHAILITLIFMLLILSVSGILIMQRSRSAFSQLATNTETPTPTPTATSIYLETPPAQSEFYDTFKNNALGWSVSSTSGYYRTVKPGELTLINTNSGTTLVESLPTNSTFDNFTIIVDVTILKASLGDSVGIYVRGDSNLEHDYRIDLNGDGTFDIAKEYLDSENKPRSTILFGPGNDSALNPQGQHNIITLTMSGSKMQLFINNVQACIVTDSDYTTGQVALFANLSKESQDVTVSFHSVEIDKLQSSLSGN